MSIENGAREGVTVKCKPSSFGFLAIVFLFLFSPCYGDIQIFLDADCASSDEKFENPDVEDLPIDKQLSLILGSCPFVSPCVPDKIVLRSIGDPSPQIFSLSFTTSVLRC